MIAAILDHRVVDIDESENEWEDFVSGKEEDCLTLPQDSLHHRFSPVNGELISLPTSASDNWRYPVETIARALLEDHDKVSPTSGFSRTAWNPKPWTLTSDLSLDTTMNYFSEHLSPLARRLIGSNELSLEDLYHLPDLNSNDIRGKGPGVYIMIGINKDKRVAIYIGSSHSMTKRMVSHNAVIRSWAKPKEERNNKHSYISAADKLFAESGWDVKYKMLVTNLDDQVWQYWLETILIIRFGVLEQDRKTTQFFNDAAAKLVKDLEPYAIAMVLPSIDGSLMMQVRVNRSLPISQGFEKKELKNSNCTNCGVDDPGTKWTRSDLAGYSDAILCHNCQVYARLLGRMRPPSVYKPFLANKKWREGITRTNQCGSCGAIRPRNLSGLDPSVHTRALVRLEDVGMMVCPREFEHYRKWGVLAPRPYPLDIKCENCRRPSKQKGRSRLVWSPQLEIWHCGPFSKNGARGKTEWVDIGCLPKDLTMDYMAVVRKGVTSTR